jgi:hypothetical protein
LVSGRIFLVDLAENLCQELATLDPSQSADSYLFSDIREYQCCQPAEISAAEHKSGPKKIPAAAENYGRFCTKNEGKWQKSGRTFFGCVVKVYL